MAFHSLTFILVFLPLVIGAFYLAQHAKKGWGMHVLLAASALFYALGDPSFLPLFLASILSNYLLGRMLYARTKADRPAGIALTLGILANLAPLAAFKYGWLPATRTPFAIDMATSDHLSGIPLGMSFYTLQQITFLVETWRARTAPIGFFSYSLYVAFFAQLVSGPIVRYSESAQQYLSFLSLRPSVSAFNRGFSMFVFGLAKTVLIADQLGEIIDPVYTMVANGVSVDLFDAWVAAWGYLLQLYFDFSGYSDMAVGIGLMVGLALPANFNSPLRAVSPSDCIARWHMSLTSFIRNYVFIPLYNLVNHHAALRPTRRRILAWGVATQASLTLIGIWHGSGATFVISGALIGLTTIAYQLIGLFTAKFRRHPDVSRSQWRGRASVLVALMVFGVFFRADDLPSTIGILSSMLLPDWISVSQKLDGYLSASWSPVKVYFSGFLPMTGKSTVTVAIWVGCASIIALLLPNTNQMLSILPKDVPTAVERVFARQLLWREDKRWAIVIGMLFALSLVKLGGDHMMANIYGQF